MKISAVVGFVAAFSASWLQAAPADAALLAAIKLADAPNYSWLTRVEEQGREYFIEGETDKSGISYVTMPVVASLRRRPGRGGESTINAIYKGDEQLVIDTDEGWKKPDEYSRMNGGRGGNARGSSGARRGGGPRGGPSPAQSETAYSNQQLSLCRPHDELAIIVANYTQLKADGPAVSGTLSETGVKLLLVHTGQNQIIPREATGTFRLWVTDGTIAKYEVTLQGTLAVTSAEQRREVQVHQTATTTLSKIGTTTFVVPDEARKKLGL